MSTAKFKEALEGLGVAIEHKDSPTAKDKHGNPKQIPAFSKTDEFMEKQNDGDTRVAALACARVGLKSTLEETRSMKLLSIGVLDWEHHLDGTPRLYSGGTMPIPLRYGGTHTHRLAGDWGMNMQNMPTVRGSKGKSKLRLSLKAPPGHTVVTCDLGQIEARLVRGFAASRRCSGSLPRSSTRTISWRARSLAALSTASSPARWTRSWASLARPGSWGWDTAAARKSSTEWWSALRERKAWTSP